MQKKRQRKTKLKSMVDDGESTLIKSIAITKLSIKTNNSHSMVANTESTLVKSTTTIKPQRSKKKGVMRNRGSNKVSKKKQRKLKKFLKIKATKLRKRRKKEANKRKRVDKTTGELSSRVMKRATSEKSSVIFKGMIERVSEFLLKREKKGLPIKISKFHNYFKWLKKQRKLYDSGVLIRLRIDMLNNLHDDYNWLDETFGKKQIDAYDKEIQSRFGWDSAQLAADPWFKKQKKLVDEGALPFTVINKLAMLGIKPSVANVNFDSFKLN